MQLTQNNITGTEEIKAEQLKLFTEEHWELISVCYNVHPDRLPASDELVEDIEFDMANYTPEGRVRFFERLRLKYTDITGMAYEKFQIGNIRVNEPTSDHWANRILQLVRVKT